MNILFITPQNPRTTPQLWSDIALMILQGMEHHGHHVHVVTTPTGWTHLITAIKWRWYWRVRHQTYMNDLDPLSIWQIQRHVAKEASKVDYDVIFAWLPWMTQLVDSDKPRVFWYDTTYILTQPLYYPRIAPETHRQAMALDREATCQASAAIFSNEWSRESAIRNYGAAPQRVHVVPFGANLSDIPDLNELTLAIDKRIARQSNASEAMRLLFVGGNWERKGGPVSLEILRQLNAAGCKATLTIVGCTPEVPAELMTRVDIVGRLNKYDPQHLARFRDLYLESDWFCMTSTADSSPIAYCEAFAHGLPCLGTRVGGVGEIVRSGQTGELFEWSPDTATQVANAVIRYRSNPSGYRALAEGARHAYDTIFNWQTAWKSFEGILQQSVKG